MGHTYRQKHIWDRHTDRHTHLWDRHTHLWDRHTHMGQTHIWDRHTYIWKIVFMLKKILFVVGSGSKWFQNIRLALGIPNICLDFKLVGGKVLIFGNRRTDKLYYYIDSKWMVWTLPIWNYVLHYLYLKSSKIGQICMKGGSIHSHPVLWIPNCHYIKPSKTITLLHMLCSILSNIPSN